MKNRIWHGMKKHGGKPAGIFPGVVVGMLIGIIANAQDLQRGYEAFRDSDYDTALQELRPLANDGVPDAQYLLGLMYLSGQGVPLDFVRAHAWANIAAAQGHEPAGQMRDILTESMTPGQIAEARQLADNWVRSLLLLGTMSGVSFVQQALASLGYAPGPVDGKIGSRTREAIRNFQRDNGLPVTGWVSTELEQELRDALPWRIMGN